MSCEMCEAAALTEATSSMAWAIDLMRAVQGELEPKAAAGSPPGPALALERSAREEPTPPNPNPNPKP